MTVHKNKTSVKQPNLRGWGEWPGPANSKQAKAFEKEFIVRIKPLVKRPDLVFSCHKDVAAPFGHLLAHIEAIHDLNHTQDDWCFCIRPNKNNPNSPSWHSWGLAFDLDANDNPNAATHTTFQPEDKIRELAHAFGFRWGYDYNGTTDPMHFEYAGTRAQAQYATWFMAQSPAVQTSHPKPYVFPG